MILHNDRGPMPPDVPVSSVFTVEIEDQDDALATEPRFTHEIPHPFKGYVIAQVFDQAGQFIALPGSGRSWKQIPHGILVPVLSRTYYPLMVVMVG